MENCLEGSENMNRSGSTGFISDIVGRLDTSYSEKQGINHIEGFNLPSKKEISLILDDLQEIIFPGFSEKKILSLESIGYFIGDLLTRVFRELTAQIRRSLRYQCEKSDCQQCGSSELAENASKNFLNKLPELREWIKLDVMAAMDGDPAAKSLEEVILSYPGIHAITVHRISHELYYAGVPLIPRMMSEHAHSQTGIDIHPGAKIGKRFFIDHGTGVVIGETAEIGDNVKIYQGVTIGALSFPKDDAGKIIKGLKRHPTLENNTTIYSGATILGDIIIGEYSVIGGNVWLTESVKKGTVVTITKPNLNIKNTKEGA